MSEEHSLEVVETKPFYQMKENVYYCMEEEDGCTKITFMTQEKDNSQAYETVTCESFVEVMTKDESHIEIKSFKLEKDWYKFFILEPKDVTCVIYIKQE